MRFRVSYSVMIRVRVRLMICVRVKVRAVVCEGVMVRVRFKAKDRPWDYVKVWVKV